MSTVCRLCLQHAIDSISLHYTDTSGFSTQSLVKALVPELYLGLSQNPVVCKTCYIHLRQAYVFRLRCLKSENLIGIYIRETRNLDTLILLDDVVNFWKKRYENISDDSTSEDGNEVEAFAEKEQDLTSDLQKKNTGSESEIARERAAGCTGVCPDNKNCTLCKFREVKEKEGTNKQKSIGKNNDKLIVIEDVAKDFDDFMNKACIDTPSEDTTETIKIIIEEAVLQSHKEKYKSWSNLPSKVITQDAAAQDSIATETPEDGTETLTLVIEEGLTQTKENFKQALKLKLVPKVATKRDKNDDASKSEKGSQEKIGQTGTAQGEPPQTDKCINLIYDVNDMDITGLASLLQKDENLKKLGLSTSDSSKNTTYFLEKFIDETDNSLSFGLSQNREEEPITATAIDAKNVEKGYVVMEKPEVVNKPMEEGHKNDNIVDDMKRKLSTVTSANEPVKLKQNIMNTSLKSLLYNRPNDGKKDEEVADLVLDENVAEANSNSENLERDPTLLNDRIEPGKDDIADNRVPENRQNVLSNKPDSSTKEVDEESIGNIMFRKERGEPPDQLPSTSQVKPPANPMPVIRVKPASALQKVRTLNHELWPQKDDDVRNTLQALYPVQDMAGDLPRVLHQFPAVVADGEEKRPPIVLNSKLGLDSHCRDPAELTSLLTPITKFKKKPPILKTYKKKITGEPKLLKRVVNPLTFKALEEMQKLGLIQVMGIVEEPHTTELTQQSIGSKAYSVNSEYCPGNSGDIPENSGDVGSVGDPLTNSGNITSNSGDNLRTAVDKRGSRDERNEDVIDIKEEPLNCTASDILMDFGQDDRVGESEGEKTRSASETSFMDSLNTENDIVKKLVDNIPEVGEEQYDQPEYVHINNVTFSDLTKLMGESKQHRENIQKTEQQMQPTESSMSEINPLRLQTHITKIRRNERTKLVLPELVSIQRQGSSYIPGLVQMNRPSTTKSRAGKRLRLIQVDAEGREIPDVEPKKRRRANMQSVLRNNVERKPPPSVPTESNDNRRNVCVLFTSFTSEGDYINDHDYLISPYVRNNMFFRRGLEPACLCLLCDYEHMAADHIVHMKLHRTMCKICLVDFHNVFILNLHVRCHSSYCFECNATVTYAAYTTHAQEHNRSLTLSNIDLPADAIRAGLRGRAATTSQDKQETQPDPGKGSYKSLVELLNEPIKYAASRVSDDSGSPSTNLRRSRRLRNSRKQESYVDSEEEACIYDKTTLSFITPTAEKQQKSIANCTSDEQKTYSNKAVPELNTNSNSSYTIQEKADVSDAKETENSNISRLFCDENLADFENDAEILTDSKTGIVGSHSASIQQGNISKTVTKKKKKTVKHAIKHRPWTKRRKRLTGRNLIKPVLMISQTKSSDLVGSDDVQTVPSVEEGSESGIAVQVNNDSSKTDKLMGDLFKRKLSVRKRWAANKGNFVSDIAGLEYVSRLKKGLGNVKTYGRSNKRDANNKMDNSISAVPAEKDDLSSPPPSTSIIIDGTDDRISKKNTKESCQTGSLTRQKATKPIRGGSSISENDNQRKDHPSKTLAKSKSDSFRSGKVNKKLQNPALSESRFELDFSGNSLSGIVHPESTAADNIKTPDDSTMQCVDSTKVSLDSTRISLTGTDTSRDTTEESRKSASSSTSTERESPLRGDLKMKIKSLNYSPFISLTDVITEVLNRKDPIFKTFDRRSSKKKCADNSEIISPALSVEKEPNIPIADSFIQGRLNVSDSSVKKSGNTDKKKVGQDKTDSESDPVTTASKARSSRSRGSLGLVEGLKDNEIRRGSKTSKKSAKSLQNSSSVNLDTSQSNSEALSESFQLNKEDPAAKRNMETSQLKVTDVNESGGSPIQKAESKKVD